MVLYSPAEIRTLAGLGIYLNGLLALLGLMPDRYRIIVASVAALLLLAEAVWVVAMRRHPERFGRGVFLFITYSAAFGSLSVLVIGVGLLPSKALLIVALYALGCLSLYLAAPRLVSLGRTAPSWSRKWNLWDPNASGGGIVPGLLGSLGVLVLSRVLGEPYSTYFSASLMLLFALFVVSGVFFNLVKYRQYPAEIRRRQESGEA